MSWNNIVGQEKTKLQIKNIFEKKNIHQAYLFIGKEGVGKDAIAIEFAKLLNCTEGNTEACDKCFNCINIGKLQHPNLKLIFQMPTKNSEENLEDETLSNTLVEEIRNELKIKSQNYYHKISIIKANEILIDSIRQIIKELSLSVFSNGKRIILISNADLMNEKSQNAFLRTLEEPPFNTTIILTTSSLSHIKETIQSRCQKFYFDDLTSNEIENALIKFQNINNDEAKIISHIAFGSYGNALKLLHSDLNMMRKNAIDFLRLIASKSVSEVIYESEKIAKEFSRENLVNFFSLILLWFRDIFLHQNGFDVVNIDMIESIKKFCNKYKTLSIEKIFNLIEKHISLSNKNAYILLSLSSFSLELKQILKNAEE